MAIDRPGAALVAIRWAKASAESRAAQARIMNDARWAEHRAELAAQGKTIRPRRKPKPPLE